MRIQNKLIIAFLLIVLLFALNLLVYFLGEGQRSNAMSDLLNAVERQKLMIAIRHDLEVLHKKNSLLVQLNSSDKVSEISSDEFNYFDQQTSIIKDKIKKIHSLLPDTETNQIESFEQAFIALVDSWRKFYIYFGRDHTKALVELATKTEPISSNLIQVLLPDLEVIEKQLEAESRQKYLYISSLFVTFTTTLFLISIFLAILIAVILARNINRSLSRLSIGAEKIGKGELEQRISIQGEAELASLAMSFNEMAERLEQAKEQQEISQLAIEEKHKEVQEQQQRAEKLLLNILPKSIASELKHRGEVTPQYFEDATILFADIVGFTHSTLKLSADQLVMKLHLYFSEFDKITERYGIEKIKTIGDCYMCVSGLPVRTASHPVDMVFAAMEMINCVEQFKNKYQTHWDIRIGIHTGPIISGVVGFRKFAFDVWGETINFSSRVEAAGATGKINISTITKERVKDFFYCLDRGEIKTKEGTLFPMHFVEGILPELLECNGNDMSLEVNKRYQMYFQKELVALPEFMSKRPATLTTER